MIERVGVAELKARLSEYLRRNREIARIVPLESSDPLIVRKRSGLIRCLADIPLPPPLELDIDVLELLAEEREPRP